MNDEKLNHSPRNHPLSFPAGIMTSKNWYSLAIAGSGVREESQASDIPEIEIQARWYAGEFGTRWVTTDGVPVRIIDFGEWNREPGPDFTGATVVFDDGEIQRGDVEIDTDVRDWENHGHARNPSFERTILHVFVTRAPQTFFTRTPGNRLIRQVQLNLAETSGKRRFSGIPQTIPVCKSRAHAEALLLAAARHRMDRKAAALARCATACGEEESLFRALATALGYKRNKLPFLLLAERTGIRSSSGPSGEALLFGLAGFLAGTEPAVAAKPVKEYLRGIWEHWWTLRAARSRLVLDPALWTFGGVRPANHPHRRVAALSAIATHWKPIIQALNDGNRDDFVARMQGLQHPFWSRHFTLTAATLTTPHALIGGQRVLDMLLNVFYPHAISKSATAWDALMDESGPEAGRGLASLADRFFPNLGIDRKFLARAAYQQGLLQLDADYQSAPDPERFITQIQMHLAGEFQPTE